MKAIKVHERCEVYEDHESCNSCEDEGNEM